MISIIGIIIVLGAIAGGYLMEHGKFLVLAQPAELLIILRLGDWNGYSGESLPTLMRLSKA